MVGVEYLTASSEYTTSLYILRLSTQYFGLNNGNLRYIYVYVYVIARVGVKFVPEISRLTVLLKINTIASLLFIYNVLVLSSLARQ